MAQREMYSSLNPGMVQAVANASLDADAESAAIDLAGYNSALVLYSFGIEGITLSTTNKIEGTITHCDTSDGTFVDASGSIKGSLPVADGNADIPAAFQVAYLGGKRYIKVGFNFSGTHGAATPVSAIVLRGHKSQI